MPSVAVSQAPSNDINACFATGMHVTLERNQQAAHHAVIAGRKTNAAAS